MDMIRILLLRVIVILGWLPNLFLYWLCYGPEWRDEHRRIVGQMWRGERP